MAIVFQSQTRRLLPRNQAYNSIRQLLQDGFNRRRDACFLATDCASLPAHRLHARFNRRRDACFLATQFSVSRTRAPSGFQSQTRRLLPRNQVFSHCTMTYINVSIADATLASSQLNLCRASLNRNTCFNRRRDACFLATPRQAREAYGS